MNCEVKCSSRQEYVMGGSYIDYGYPVEPEGEATVQVHVHQLSCIPCKRDIPRWNMLAQLIYKEWPLRPQ